VEAAAGLEADAVPEPVRAARPFNDATVDRHIWGLTVPAVGESLLQTSLLLVDTLMISRFGSVAIAASAVSGTILWRSHMTFGCIERGTTAMVARASGEGDRERASRVVAQSILLACAIGVAMMLAGVLGARKYLEWMGAMPDVVDAATPYLRVIFLASLPRLFNFVSTAALRGVGDTRTPMRISFWMNIQHIATNFVLIFGHLGFPRLGLLGSGISTALAMCSSAAAITWVVARDASYFRLRPRHFRPHTPTLRTLLRLAVPAFLDELVVSIGFLVFFSYIARLGTSVLAAHAISTRTESVSFMVGFGFSVAAATMVGQALGMGSVSLARLVFRRTTAYCVGAVALVALLLILRGETFMRWMFHPEEEVLAVARMLILIAAVEQPLLGLVFTLSGGIRGAGDTLSPMIASAVGNILVRIFIVHWLAFGLGWGIFGVYIGTVIDWVARVAILFAAYAHGRWTRMRV
jgi:putative MATE family efflux protein